MNGVVLTGMRLRLRFIKKSAQRQKRAEYILIFFHECFKAKQKNAETPKGVLGLLEKKNELKIDSWVRFIFV
mgnify:FL=1